MLSLRTLVPITAAMAILGVLGAVSWPGQAVAAGPPSFDVIVDNPVTLNPATPNPVTITNPPGTPPSTVTIANPVGAADIAKALGIQHPFTANEACDAFSGPVFCTVQFAQPANQRTVVEYISGRCENNISGALNPPFTFDVSIIPAGSFSGPRIGINQPDPAAQFNGVAQFGQVVRIYLDPGVSLQVETPVNTGSVSCKFAISGQHIDAP